MCFVEAKWRYDAQSHLPTSQGKIQPKRPSKVPVRNVQCTSTIPAPKMVSLVHSVFIVRAHSKHSSNLG